MWLQVQTVTSIPAQQLEDSLATGRILPEGSLINMLFLSCRSSDCLHPVILSNIAGQIKLICTRVLSRIMSLERKLYEALSGEGGG